MRAEKKWRVRKEEKVFVKTELQVCNCFASRWGGKKRCQRRQRKINENKTGLRATTAFCPQQIRECSRTIKAFQFVIVLILFHPLFCYWHVANLLPLVWGFHLSSLNLKCCVGKNLQLLAHKNWGRWTKRWTVICLWSWLPQSFRWDEKWKSSGCPWTA